MEDNRLSPAIQLAKAGHKKEARRLLEAILKDNPNNATAWLWMSDVAGDNREKISFLKSVLNIDPENVFARKGLLQLGVEPEIKQGVDSSSPRSPDSQKKQLDPSQTKLETLPTPSSIPRASTKKRQVFLIAGFIIVMASLLAVFVICKFYPFNCSLPTPASVSVLDPTNQIPATWTPTSENFPLLGEYIFTTSDLNILCGETIWLLSDEPEDFQFDGQSESGAVDYSGRAWISDNGAGTLSILVTRFKDASYANDAYNRLIDGAIERGDHEITISSEHKAPWTSSSCFRETKKGMGSFTCNFNYNTIVLAVIFRTTTIPEDAWEIPFNLGWLQMDVLESAGF